MLLFLLLLLLCSLHIFEKLPVLFHRLPTLFLFLLSSNERAPLPTNLKLHTQFDSLMLNHIAESAFESLLQ